MVGEQLPKARGALGMESHPSPTAPLRYGQMIESFLRVDPFECILCGHRMRFKAFDARVGRKNIVNEALSKRGEAIT